MDKSSQEFKQLAQDVYKICHLTGEFKLRSGTVSHEYFDKYRFEAQPELLKRIGKQMRDLVPVHTQVLAGLEMGGIPIAVALAYETGLPMCFVRKEAKDYGTCLFAEGTEVDGKRLLIVEDVITTGGQVVESTRDLRDSGAVITDVLCAIYRGEGPPTRLETTGLKMHSLFQRSDFKN